MLPFDRICLGVLYIVQGSKTIIEGRGKRMWKEQGVEGGGGVHSTDLTYFLINLLEPRNAMTSK